MALKLPPKDLLHSAREKQFSLSEFTRYIDTKPERALEPGERALFGFIVPAFQRPVVWTTLQSIRFIESLWLSHDVGRYLVNIHETRTGLGKYDRVLLDGQQRLTAIQRYMRDEFEVFGAKYSELSKPEELRFQRRGFTRFETSLDNLEDLRELYERLAYGGVPHQAEKTIAALKAAQNIVQKELDGEPIDNDTLHDAQTSIEVAMEEWEPERYVANEITPPTSMM